MSHQSSVLTGGREELEQREMELQQVHSLDQTLFVESSNAHGCW